MRGVLVVAALLMLAGCSVALRSDVSGEGTVYFLPKSALTITVTRNVDDDGGESYTLSGTANAMPDPDKRFVLAYKPNILYDDRFCIGRQENGLLTTVQFSAEDRSQQIAVNITKLIAGSINLTDASPLKPGPTPFVMTVDPASQYDVAAFNNGLRARFGRRVRLDLSRYWRQMRPKSPPLCTNGECEIPHIDYDCPGDEICYRTQMRAPIELADAESGKPVAVSYVDVANPFDIGRVSIPRTMLVERITKLWFGPKSGALTGIVMRKPSEVEGVTFLPINVVKAAITTPSGLLSQAFLGSSQKENIPTNLLSPSSNALSGGTLATGTTTTGYNGAGDSVLNQTCVAGSSANLGFLDLAKLPR